MNWRERLHALLRHPDAAAHRQAHALASYWETCAVGENRARLEARGIEFLEDGSPEDYALTRLGDEFCYSVKTKQYTRALHTLERIQHSASEMNGKERG